MRPLADICWEGACERRAVARGLCRLHYGRRWAAGLSTDPPLPTMPDLSLGACVGRDDITFVRVFGRSRKSDVQQALALCDGCVVKARCLSYAIEAGESGIWGGEVLGDERLEEVG